MIKTESVDAREEGEGRGGETVRWREDNENKKREG